MTTHKQVTPMSEYEIKQPNTDCYVISTDGNRHIMSLADIKEVKITEDGKVELPVDHVCSECVTE